MGRNFQPFSDFPVPIADSKSAHCPTNAPPLLLLVDSKGAKSLASSVERPAEARSGAETGAERARSRGMEWSTEHQFD